MKRCQQLIFKNNTRMGSLKIGRTEVRGIQNITGSRRMEMLLRQQSLNIHTVGH